jgi:hypothetical protein
MTAQPTRTIEQKLPGAQRTDGMRTTGAVVQTARGV